MSVFLDEFEQAPGLCYLNYAAIGPWPRRAACRQRGVLLCIHAVQQAGALPFNVERYQCDFAMADGHKWMLGPEGAGRVPLPWRTAQAVETARLRLAYAGPPRQLRAPRVATGTQRATLGMRHARTCSAPARWRRACRCWS
ncbi:hypothetical protein EMIT047CA2_190085 [Pseudomonas soli]